MSDSFFGFNTTLPGDDRDDDDDSEFEYDALNDETFGAATNGDWEDLHENLVQLERTVHDDDDEDDVEDNLRPAKGNSSGVKDSYRNDFHSLEQDLLRLGLRNIPAANDDDFERITLDPRVWAPPTPAPPPPVQRTIHNTGPGHGLFGMHQFPGPMLSGPKMCTLEDIERNMRSQPGQQINGHPHPNTENNLFPPPPPTSIGSGSGAPLNAPSRLPPGFGPAQQQQQQQQPPLQGFPPPNNNNFGPPFPMNRAPQGFPPMMGPPPPMHGGGGAPHSPNQYNKRLVMEIQQTHPLLGYHRMNHPGMPHPMHPMFLQQPPHHPHHPHSMPPPPPHPMMGPGGHPMMMNGGKMPPHPHQHQQPQRGYSPMGGGARDGNLSLSEEGVGGGGVPMMPRDEYRNLMTPRDKQWLIGIQLLQLNTETPYIDDYYYTVYKERRMQGRRENKFHTDNQLNHPLTQPQGHAQLVLQSIGNRNNNKGVFANNRDNGRDRKSSESRSGGANGNDKDQQQQQQQQTPRTYTPLQFENSLGKLQCGSVTAPRKIIDMEIMAAEAGATTGGNLEVTAQRKCRQMLLHIETLYRVVLKLEDLKNPTAIEAVSLLREKKERERKAVQEAAEREAAAIAAAAAALAATEGGLALPLPPPLTTTSSATTTVGGGRLNIESVLSEDKSRIGEETLEELLRVLVLGLSPEKVVGMMAVRKGRTLLQRAMAQLEAEMECVWPSWLGIVMAVPLALKKDREDTETQLLSFCTVLKRHASAADLKQMHVLGQGVEQKAAILLATKFGAGVIILMISRVEDLFVTAKDTINMTERREWNALLSNLCAAAVTVTEGKELQPPTPKQLLQLEKVIAHLLRFPDLTSSQALLKALASHALEEL